MKLLKTTPQKKWYRIKDGVIYDILSSQPSSKLSEDYIAYNDIRCKLPFILLSYGFYDEETKTLDKIGYSEKLYLDSYIERGDIVEQRDDMYYYFLPYYNNSEVSGQVYATSYMCIHENEIQNEIKPMIINNTSKKTILNNIPYYCKTINYARPYITSKRTVIQNGEKVVVNCIYSVQLQNDNYKITNFDDKLDKFTVDVINEHCNKIANNIISTQKLNLDNVNGYKYNFSPILKQGEENPNYIELSIFPQDVFDYKTNTLTIYGTIGDECTKITVNRLEKYFEYFGEECDNLEASRTIVYFAEGEVIDQLTLRFHYKYGKSSLENLVINHTDIWGIKLNNLDISGIKNMCAMFKGCKMSSIENKGITFNTPPSSYVGPLRDEETYCFNENGIVDLDYAPLYGLDDETIINVPSVYQFEFMPLLKDYPEENIHYY